MLERLREAELLGVRQDVPSLHEGEHATLLDSRILGLHASDPVPMDPENV